MLLTILHYLAKKRVSVARTLPILGIALSLSNLSYAQKIGINFLEEPAVAYKARAAESGKLLFIEAYTPYCAPCKEMQEDIFSNKDVMLYMEKHFICIKEDISSPHSGDFVNKYEAFYAPTLLFCSAEGELLAKEVGKMSVSNFLKLAQSVVNGEPSPHFASDPMLCVAKNPKTEQSFSLEQSMRSTAPNTAPQDAYCVYTDGPQVFYTSNTQPKAVSSPVPMPTPAAVPTTDIMPIYRADRQKQQQIQRYNEISQSARNVLDMAEGYNASLITEYIQLSKQLQKSNKSALDYYLNKVIQARNSVNISFLSRNLTSLNSKTGKFILDNMEKFKSELGADYIYGKIRDLARQNVLEAIYDHDENELDAVVAFIEEANMPDAAQQIFKAKSTYYLGVENWNSYQKVVTQYFQQTDPSVQELEDAATNFHLYISAKSALDNATKWIEEAIRISPTEDNYYTASYIAYKKGDLGKAKYLCENALNLAKLHKNPTHKIEELEQKILYRL